MRNADSRTIDDSKEWANIAMGLAKLQMANEFASEFGKKMGHYLSKEDKVEITGLIMKQESLYWKYWEKLIRKIRGI